MEGWADGRFVWGGREGLREVVVKRMKSSSEWETDR